MSEPSETSEWVKDAAGFGIEKATYSKGLLTIITADPILGVSYLNSRKINEASIELNEDGIVAIQAPLPAPRPPPKRERHPTTISRMMAVLDQYQTKDTDDIGIKDVAHIGSKIVGEISDIKTFANYLSSHNIQPSLKIRDNAGYIGALSSRGEVEGDFTLPWR